MKVSKLMIPAVALIALLAAAGCVSGSDARHDTAEGTDTATPGGSGSSGGSYAAMLTVPAGTPLVVEFQDGVSSETSQAGDRFGAALIEPVRVDGKLAIPSGTMVYGTVVEANPADKVGGVARLNLAFDSLVLPSGEELPIAAGFVEQGKKQTKKDAATIGGATAGGALLGNVIGEERGDEAEGTKIGAVVGAAVGTAIAATNKNDPVSIPSGTVLNVVLETPVSVEARS